MPVIAFASPKGGVGKTTSSLILATTLAEHSKDPNFRVVLIDGDDNKPNMGWAKDNAATPGCPQNIEVMAAPSESTIMEEIRDASRRANFVLVDLEGAATALLTYAITLADFVIVPLQGSKLDAKEAEKIVRLMRNQAEMRGKPIPHAVLFTRTNTAIKPGNLKHVYNEVDRHGIQNFSTQLNEREPFKDMFSFGMTLNQLLNAYQTEAQNAKKNNHNKELRQCLTKIESIRKAIVNANNFSLEVVNTIEQIKPTR